MKFYVIIILLGTAIVLTTLFVAIINTIKFKANTFAIKANFFVSLGLLASVNTILFNYKIHPKSEYFNFYQELIYTFQFSIIFSVIINEINDGKILKIISKLLPLLVTTFITISVLRHIYRFPLYIQTLQNPIIIFICIRYFLNILKSEFIFELRNSPQFWFILGAFIFSTMSFPAFAFSAILKNIKNSDFSNTIYTSVNISLMIFYILIIKACSCLKHTQNS